jgi:hypothetical protein
MKNALHNLVISICLITMLLTSTSCIHADQQPTQSPCSHCAKQTPIQQSVPSCCKAHHQQPAAAIISAGFKQPVIFADNSIPPFANAITPFILPHHATSAGPPPHSPLLALRI